MMWGKKKEILICYREDRPSYHDVDNEAMASLVGHPGFEAYRNKLQIQKKVLEDSVLNGEYDFDTIKHMKSGIYWLGFLEREIEKLTGRSRRVTAPATVDELEQFNKIRASIEAVCVPQEQGK